MQSLKYVLSRQTPVNWVQTPTSPETSAQSTHVTATITDVTVDAYACKLSFKDNRLFRINVLKACRPGSSTFQTLIA